MLIHKMHSFLFLSLAAVNDNNNIINNINNNNNDNLDQNISNNNDKPTRIQMFDTEEGQYLASSECSKLLIHFFSKIIQIHI